jgi:glycosyl hydrolase family 113
MMRRKLLLTAGLALLLGVSGLTTYAILKPVLAPTAPLGVAAQAPATAIKVLKVLNPRTNPSDFQAGVTVVIYGNDPNFDIKARQELNRLAALGANSVGLVFPIYQSTAMSADVHADPTSTPSSDRIALFIREAHRRGFTVLLRPLLDEHNLALDGQWRGTIQPTSVEAWFQAYDDVILGYARLAQKEQVDAFGVGSELNSLEVDGAQWLRTINLVRNVYSGLLTYSSTSGNGYPARFAGSLDFLGVDAYYPMGVQAGATVNELELAWRPWTAELKQIQQASGKPVAITELGTPSRTGSYLTPWTLKPGAPLDLEAQRRYYQASCSALSGFVPGLYWWYTTLDPSPAPRSDTGYNPSGKPAEVEIEKCFRTRTSTTESPLAAEPPWL